MCALINGSLGFLMYLRKPGDTGFTSRNPAYAGSLHEVVKYRLSNGQVDEYPAHWALPLLVVEQALEYFRSTGRQPEFVVWNDDAV
jgi:hypothetical protein